MAAKAKYEEAKADMINSAFVAHQLGAGSGSKFADYLARLGLSGDGRLPGPASSVSTEEAIAKAERIRAWVKDRSN